MDILCILVAVCRNWLRLRCAVSICGFNCSFQIQLHFRPPGLAQHRSDQEMKMIARQTIGVDLPAALLRSLSQRLQKQAMILIVQENGLPAVSSIHHARRAEGQCEDG